MTDKKLLSCTKSGVKIIPADNNTSPLTLPEPVWIPDKEILKCSLCKNKFDLFNRKHHCRRCGKCICNKCCHKKPLPRMCFIDPVLQCNLCSLISNQENIFFEEHLKCLLQGSVINVINSDGGVEEDFNLIFCKMKQNHRELIFQCDNKNISNKLNSIKMLDIKEMKKMTLNKHSDIIGLKVLYKDSHGESHDITLKATLNSSNQHSQVQWLISLYKAYELMTECKDLTVNSAIIEE